jgi:serine/threonine-protein kinase
MNNNFYYDDILRDFPDAKPVAIGGQKVVFSVNLDSYGETILKIGRYRSENTLRRIQREVMVLRSVRSRYYPRNYDFAVVDENRFLILEEKIEGYPLSECMNDFSTVQDATRLIQSLVTGLKILWNRRIIHRDIKPQNIMIKSDREPVIVDLGIARILDMQSLTQTLLMRGPCTPAYASPEQLQNRKPQIDHRSDQFSLGIVFAQLLLDGLHPFDPQVVNRGTSFVENILNCSWARDRFNGKRYVSIRPILERMLGREPHERFRTPEMLQQQLESLINVNGG